jgi:archaellum component FlaC
MTDEALLELIKATRDDVVTIRDNHLAHINDDIHEIKDSVKEMSMRVSAIEDTINTIKNHWWKIVSLVIAGILGVDMGSDMVN